MSKTSNGEISRVVRTEVGRLSGSMDAMIVRIEHVPLAADEDQKPGVTVFVLNQHQVAVLEEQILESLGTISAAPFGPKL